MKMQIDITFLDEPKAKPQKIKVPSRDQIIRRYGVDNRARDFPTILQSVYADAIKACGCEVEI